MNVSDQDVELVARTVRGDTTAYVDLVRRYERSARVVAMRHLQDHHAVEDAVQQAFLIGFEKLSSLRKPDRFGAWILRIVQREAQAHCRSRSKTVAWFDTPELTVNESQRDESLQETIELLNALPEHERVVVTLHYLDSHSTPVIAAMLSRPLGTVTKQLSRAIERLRKLAQKPERIHDK